MSHNQVDIDAYKFLQICYFLLDQEGILVLYIRFSKYHFANQDCLYNIKNLYQILWQLPVH